VKLIETVVSSNYGGYKVYAGPPLENVVITPVVASILKKIKQ
jgi:hypothetical protein